MDCLNNLPALLVTGSSGKMGKEILSTAENLFTTKTCRREDIEKGISECDIIIDFTLPEFTPKLLEAAISKKKPIVIGTTGYSEEQKQEIVKAAQEIPIVLSANFSIGIHLLKELAKSLASQLSPEEFDIEIIEMHHRYKKDAPSGTALSLLNSLEEGRGESRVIYGRKGISIRKEGEIAIHTLRGGDVVGDHSILFSGEGEALEIKHKASSRKTFAKGAIHAAKWLLNQNEPKLYSMSDVLEK